MFKVWIALIIAVGVAGCGGQPPTAPTTAKIDGADSDRKADDTLKLNDVARDVIVQAQETPAAFDLAGDLRGTDPTKAGVIDGPWAAQEWPGCKTAFVPSFSSRRGVKPRAIGLHYTAGGERIGWSDLDGLTGYSANVRNQVSWHFGVDREGHCTYNVPVTQKAWTISGLNNQTVNIEMVGTGREPNYGGTAGLARLKNVVTRIGRIYDIPIRMGATDGNCNVTRKGVITHWMGGPCSGGHIDIKPYDIKRVVKSLAAYRITATDRVTCRKLNWWRARGKPHGLPEQRAVRRRKALESRGVVCRRSGPVRKVATQ